MAIARVGSLGTAVTGTTSVTPTFAQTTTANNLLVAWLAENATTANTPSGWTKVFGSNGTYIYYKIAAGSDAAPAFSDGVASFMAAVVNEFSGVNTTTPTDTGSGDQAVVTSPTTATAGGADATNALVVSLWRGSFSMSATKTTSITYNNGGTDTSAGNNDASSVAEHFRFGYAINTGHASADAVTFTFTTTAILNAGQSFRAFAEAAGGGGGGNPDFSPQGQMGFYGA